MPLVIVDTSTWIEYFRNLRSAHGDEVEQLVRESRVVVVGVVYAELLHGARSESELRTLEDTLGELPFLESDKEAWRRAGYLLLELRRRGRIIPLADALIAALALAGDHQVYSLDEHFRDVPGLELYQAGS